MSKDNGGRAFPKASLDPWGKTVDKDLGMTLRDYFAAKAMQGWIAAAPKIMGEDLDGTRDMANVVSIAAYTMADAMLEARAQ